MIIIHVMGGLGNQLYQYALSEKLKSLGREVKLDFHAYKTATGDEREWRKLELEWLEGLEYKECTKAERTLFLDNDLSFFSRVRRKLFGRRNRTVNENKAYMPEIYDMDDIYLYGFWGCDRYYNDIMPVLWKRIHFPRSSNPKNIEAIQEMEKHQSVSIHIRRKDYLTVADGKRYMGICSDEYYKTAVGYICERVENPVFYVFSDDLDYAGTIFQTSMKEKFGKMDMHIVDWNTGDDSFYDMQLMSKCKHNICANSTFSLWGARLNQYKEKIMVRPLRHDNYEEINIQQMHENWSRWVMIDENGMLV